MDRKNLPVIMMLVAGAIASIASFVRNWGVPYNLLIILLTLVLFYGLGTLLEKTLDNFDATNEKRMQEQEALEEQLRREELEQAMREIAQDEQ